MASHPPFLSRVLVLILLTVFILPTYALQLLGDWDGLSSRTASRMQELLNQASLLTEQRLEDSRRLLLDASTLLHGRLEHSESTAKSITDNASAAVEKHLERIDGIVGRVVALGHAGVTIAVLWLAVVVAGRFGGRWGVAVVPAFFLVLYPVRQFVM